jgi:LacI family transcriptional regulator
VAAGHRRIGLIAGPREIYTASERNRGFRLAIEEAGISPENSPMICGDYTIEGGARAMSELRREHPELTAVVISNYEMTVGAMIEVNESGIHLPQELSIIGFDNLEFARACSPQLSIMTQPTREMAKEAVRLLLEALEGDRKGKTETVMLPIAYEAGKSVRQL